MFVLAAAFIGYFGLLLHSDLTRPEPAGFVFGIHESRMFVRAVAPASNAARAGLVVGDRVVQGRPVQRQEFRGQFARDQWHHARAGPAEPLQELARRHRNEVELGNQLTSRSTRS